FRAGREGAESEAASTISGRYGRRYDARAGPRARHEQDLARRRPRGVWPRSLAGPDRVDSSSVSSAGVYLRGQMILGRGGRGQALTGQVSPVHELWMDFATAGWRRSNF